MNKIDVAVLGLGGMGATHVKAAKDSPWTENVYGYEPDPERCRKRAGELGIQAADLNEILNNPAVKFVSIAASNDAHLPLAEAALRAGKAVLCEKPMGNTLEEASRLIQIKNETRGFFQIGFELHYSKMYQKIKEWIDSGAIGDVVNVQCRYFCCEFHRKNNWRSNGTGSFLIGEKLSHYLDLQRWFFSGAQIPETVYSLSAPKVVPYFHHRDNHQILTRYSKGGVASLNFIMYSAESLHVDPLIETIQKQSDDGHYLQYLVCGTKGVLETDVFKRRMRRFEFSEVEDGLDNNIVETITFPKEEDLVFFHNTYGQNLRVIELVAQGRPPEVPSEDAYRTMQLCFAAERSEDTGRIVRLDEMD
ncbi:MAG: Gfo/Idh/MocA family oxidoreductase [Lentisphaeria bacterium]|nr:Gfo/Idh/MocA family oxidoreductase [Lentisphaeria bacterium]